MLKSFNLEDTKRPFLVALKFCHLFSFLALNRSNIFILTANCAYRFLHVEPEYWIKKKDLIIGHKIIGDSHPCFIIAEIGQNHQGDINIAKKLIDVAKESGADCVKFQKSCMEEKYTKSVLDAEYTSCNSWGKTYGEHKRFLEFTEQQFIGLQDYACSKDIMFTASSMDPASLKFLAKIKVPFIKIGSGDSDNLYLIDEASKIKIPLVISTGMLDGDGLKKVYETVIKHHNDVAFLHCVSSYPTPINEANLKAILTLNNYPVHIGYSGHEVGYNLTIGSVALGAKIIERHITLDKTMKGSDHCCSLEPEELKNMIISIREVEKGLGDGIKKVMKCEQDCMDKLGKRIVFSRNLSTGSTLKISDIKVKVCRNKDGLRPILFYNVLGQVLKKDAKEDDALTDDYL